MIMLMAALDRELAVLRRRMRLEPERRDVNRGLWRGRYHGRDLLLLRTGIGRGSAEAVARSILERHSPSVLISFGFAGALSADLDLGDIVLCTSASPAEDETAAAIRTGIDDAVLARWQDAMERAGVVFRRGGVLTTTRAILAPREKLSLYESSDALVADMESYWVARIAEQRGIPFLGVRAVSDTREERIPPLPMDRLLTPDGRSKPLEAAMVFLRHPSLLPPALRLYRSTRAARRSLAAALLLLVDALARERSP